MCGIAGIVSAERAIADPVQLARTLGAALAHRGPDDQGAWASADGCALLVHRRLAVIDPGPDGAQPMASLDGRHRIVFNGEIYNYRELRREAELRGARFRTASDTEVLLHIVAHHGPAGLARVRGMFALACWDAVERSLLLGRDRFGIKPLYVAATRHGVAFASEIAALRAGGFVEDSPSPAGVLAFLAWGSVIPPLTWQHGVETISAGGWYRWRGNTIERGVFADQRDPYRHESVPPQKSEGEYRERVGAAVRDAVRAHLVADVPVGVFLSGGIDSAAIVSAAASIGAADLQTFTVAFDDASSEADRARVAANAFGTRHHELRVDAPHVAADLPAILARLDQPTIDGINAFYVSRAVASTGIKAVLAGTGGDELFGGYPSFRRLPRAVAAKRAAGPLWPVVGAIGDRVMPGRLRTRWRHFAAGPGTFADAYRVQRGFLMPEELDAIAGPALRDDAGIWRDARRQVATAEQTLLAPLGLESPHASVARLESRLYLQSQLLRDVDVMAMAHGLEVRVPFVDHVLVDTVWPQLGCHPDLLRGKRLLYETLERPLPAEIVGHPKQGFTLPFARWMRGDLGPVVRDGLDRLARLGWIQADVPSRVWSDWETGRAHWTRPWGLAVLGHFLGAPAPSAERPWTDQATLPPAFDHA
jgi:asparagine synthase (glutamine-hydrolysing)